MGSGGELRPGCLLMLALFLQAPSAAADLALFFFWLHLFFSPLFCHFTLGAASTERFLPAAVGLRQASPGTNDQSGFIVGWKEQLGPLASASLRLSVRRLPDLFWLSAASSGDSATSQRQAIPSPRRHFASRWQSLGTENALSLHRSHQTRSKKKKKNNGDTANILKPEISSPLYH